MVREGVDLLYWQPYGHNGLQLADTPMVSVQHADADRGCAGVVGGIWFGWLQDSTSTHEPAEHADRLADGP